MVVHRVLCWIAKADAPGMLAGHNVSGGHAAAVTADGRLWVWGGNGSGQLGLGEDAEAWISAPRRVDCPGGEGSSDWPAPISAVACGAAHTAVILADGSLWVTGSNHLGCCGLPESIEEVRAALLGLSTASISVFCFSHGHLEWVVATVRQLPPCFPSFGSIKASKAGLV